MGFAEPDYSRTTVGNSAGAGILSHRRWCAHLGNRITEAYLVTAWCTNEALSSPWETVANDLQTESLALWLSKSLNQHLLLSFSKPKLATAHFYRVTILLIKVLGLLSLPHLCDLLQESFPLRRSDFPDTKAFVVISPSCTDGMRCDCILFWQT